MANTAEADGLEAIKRLADKVKDLIGELERTRAERSETIEDNQRLRHEIESLSERLVDAEHSAADMTNLLAERARTRMRVDDMLQQLEAISA